MIYLLTLFIIHRKFPTSTTPAQHQVKMPTISIGRDKLFDRIGKHFTDDAFDELCFEFGIELDDVTSERMMAEKERGSTSTSEQQDSAQFADLSDEIIYKIEIPANRYDLLCLEGLARSLRTFLSLLQRSQRILNFNRLRRIENFVPMS